MRWRDNARSPPHRSSSAVGLSTSEEHHTVGKCHTGSINQPARPRTTQPANHSRRILPAREKRSAATTMSPSAAKIGRQGSIQEKEEDVTQCAKMKIKQRRRKWDVGMVSQTKIEVKEDPSNTKKGCGGCGAVQGARSQKKQPESQPAKVKKHEARKKWSGGTQQEEEGSDGHEEGSDRQKNKVTRPGKRSRKQTARRN